jgi:uncharacterized protein YhbP (UPF0306 family)
MRSDARQLALSYLQSHRVVSLATLGSAGPWASAVFYASDGFTLFFLSAPTSRHCRNLADDPRVAATVQEDYSDWQNIKGIQMEGLMTEIDGREEQYARRIYGEKFPLVGQPAQAPVAIVKALAKVRWYQLVPSRVYFIDNSAGFGQRDEIVL